MADLKSLQEKLKRLEEAFQLQAKKKTLAELDAKSSLPEFWNQPQEAAKLQRERSECAEIVDRFSHIDRDLKDVEDFLPLVDQGDAEIDREVQSKLDAAQKSLDELEFRRMLGGEHDRANAILSINSGAGGTEAQDWVSILLRMYLRWAERNDFKSTIVDSLSGEEAGFKNVTMTIEGPYAYGYLRSEIGIHRLVRISPFDSNARRHTSFASVMVMPEIDETIEIDINEADLRIDTFRASGAGGQHVNKTDSAVRITHLPTNTVVVCQNERSQHKNKAQAMKILKARLYEKERQEKEEHRTKLAGEKMEINFGSQIRSYVMQPYQMVKDHRTEHEVGDIQSVLDGELDGFIRAFLLGKIDG